MGLRVEHVAKTFGDFQVIRDLSMEVKEGTIFGFLGANGAGKTTTMRMILDIIHPDHGQITWNGVPAGKVARQAWGYLPEERGLYPKMEVEEQLIFLARLNGVSKQDAHRDLNGWLERFQMNVNRKKKMDELSKGNQQKVQFLATILHNPSILIMDEPFSGLDPVSANMLKEAFLELHRRGKTIIFSTHQLEQVEELCEDVVIINKGQSVVQGSVSAVKRQEGKNRLHIRLDNDPQASWLDAIDQVQVLSRRQDYIELRFQEDFHPRLLMEEALRRGDTISLFEIAEPSLTDIFIDRVGNISQPDVPMSAH